VEGVAAYFVISAVDPMLAVDGEKVVKVGDVREKERESVCERERERELLVSVEEELSCFIK